MLFLMKFSMPVEAGNARHGVPQQHVEERYVNGRVFSLVAFHPLCFPIPP